MEYRIMPHTGDRVSVIGMGSSVIGARPEEEIIDTVRAAVERGINYFDMAGAMPRSFPAMARLCGVCGTGSCSRSTLGPTTPPGNMAGPPI